MKYPNVGIILEPTNQFRFRERGSIKNLKGLNVPQISTHLGFVVLQQYYRNIADREKDSGEWVSIEIDFNLGEDEK